MDKIRGYIENVRAIVALLANIFRNQLKIIVSTRVIYDKELFNYEQYNSRGLGDDRLLKHMLFLRDGKKIVSEYVTYQTKDPSVSLNLLTFDLQSWNEINLFLNEVGT